MLSGPEWLNELGTGLNFATSLVAMALKDKIGSAFEIMY
jgi:hypothetical protein